jgi:hypothetical protein
MNVALIIFMFISCVFIYILSQELLKKNVCPVNELFRECYANLKPLKTSNKYNKMLGKNISPQMRAAYQLAYQQALDRWTYLSTWDKWDEEEQKWASETSKADNLAANLEQIKALRNKGFLDVVDDPKTNDVNEDTQNRLEVSYVQTMLDRMSDPRYNKVECPSNRWKLNANEDALECDVGMDMDDVVAASKKEEEVIAAIVKQRVAEANDAAAIAAATADYEKRQAELETRKEDEKIALLKYLDDINNGGDDKTITHGSLVGKGYVPP